MADEVIASLVGRLAFEVDDDGLRKFGKGLSKAGDESDKTKRRVGFLDRQLQEFGKNAKRAAGDAIRGFQRLPITVAKAGAAIGAAAVVAGAALTVNLTQKFIESGAELDTWARKIDVSAQELQRLEFAGQTVGAEVDNTREAIKTLRENLGEMARVGSGPAVDALGTLGIELDEIKDLGATEQLQLLAEAMNDLPDQAQRVSVALEVMGEDGGALLPLFEQGAEGIAKMTARADELGVVMDERAIASAKEAKLAIGELTATATGLGQSIAARLAPKVVEVVDRLQGWFEANREIIDQKIDQFIEGVIPALEDLVEFGKEVVEVGSDMIDTMGGLENALTIAGVASVALVASMGGLPGVALAAGAAISTLAFEVSGLNAETRELRRQAREDEAATKKITKGTTSGERLLSASEAEGGLAALSDQDYTRLTQEFLEGASASGRGSRALKEVEELDVRRDAQLAIAEGRAARAGGDAVDRFLADQGLIAIAESNRRRQERERRRKKFERQAKQKGGGKVDTTRAEALFGEQIRVLGRAAGATETAQRKALEAAAQSLKGGASQAIALRAATGQLESLTGAKLQPGGPDAALFGLLTEIGGAEAARSATAGARFVRIDQSVNIDVGGIDLVLPEGAAAALSAPGFAGDVATLLEQRVTQQVFVPIVEQSRARGERP